MFTWENYEATKAFERSRRRAFVRLAKDSIAGRSKGMRYSLVLPKEEYLAEVDDLALLDVEGRTIRLPALPVAQKPAWIKDYNGIGYDEPSRRPFSTRLEDGRLVLEGGMAELRRLELRKAIGDLRVEARMSPGREPECDIIEYPEKLGAECCPDRAAS